MFSRSIDTAAIFCESNNSYAVLFIKASIVFIIHSNTVYYTHALDVFFTNSFTT